MMNEEKELLQKQFETVSKVMTDLVMRVTAMERLLLKHGSITETEFNEELKVVGDELIQLMGAVLAKNKA